VSVVSKAESRRRGRSSDPKKLPLTLRVAYREMRQKLWEPGTEQSEEGLVQLEQKRELWVKEFREKEPKMAQQAQARAGRERRAPLSSRLVHTLLIPGLCGGGFVLYLALAYGIFPLTPN
jgi:hypothetical protein